MEELTDLFDLEDNKPSSSTFTSTKCIQNATMEELNASEYLDNVFWKVKILEDLDEID